MKKALGSFLASVYRWGLELCQKSYRAVPFRIRKVSARVVSVGNITWGGTGKTPLVIMMAAGLKERGKKVAVLTRGYGKDEVEELRNRLGADIPVVVGRDRIRSANEAIKKWKPDFLLLDDGFQHIRLHRDVDVVTINATQPFGPGGLIPLGTLREPLENLARAHVFVLTKSNLGSKNLHWIHQKLLSIKPGAVIFEAVHRPVQFMDFKKNRFVPLSEIRGKRVAALSGIGDPYSFEKTVENLDADIGFAARFPDHHRYTETELQEFSKNCKEVGISMVVTTQKDYHRIEPFLKKRRLNVFQDLQLWVLQIDFEVEDEEDFIRRCIDL